MICTSASSSSAIVVSKTLTNPSMLPDKRNAGLNGWYWSLQNQLRGLSSTGTTAKPRLHRRCDFLRIVSEAAEVICSPCQRSALEDVQILLQEGIPHGDGSLRLGKLGTDSDFICFAGERKVRCIRTYGLYELLIDGSTTLSDIAYHA